ncbi:MAG TPA: efflux RND transporter periplasmic adaptor subunit [Terriglobia bacterium]|nr:efflux RND transporter periplasmic adaptor subunit [Terriglobia bacterium]
MMFLYPVRRKLFAAGLVLSALLTLPACSNSVADKRANSAAGERPLQVRSVPVKVNELRRNVESVGSLFALEEVTVSSEVDGKVDEVLVDVGDHVERGQALINVSTIELKLALDQQRALYQQARARLGVTGESEDLKNVLDAAEIKKAAADLKEAQEIYKRSQLLLDKQLLPRQDFDQTEARMHAANAAYDLAVQSVQNLRAQLPQYRAAVELAEKKLRDAVIRAPFKGQVKERVVAPGQYLKVQTPVIVIVSVDPLRVRLKIPEPMAGWIRTADRIQVSVDAYPDKTFSGKLSRINPTVDPQSRTFEVEALLENSEELLKPGFFVKARIPSGKVDRVLAVPQDALQYSYGVYKVCLIQGDLLKETEVKLGEVSGGAAEVVSGVKAGDMIAVPAKGQVLKDGARIQIVE